MTKIFNSKANAIDRFSLEEDFTIVKNVANIGGYFCDKIKECDTSDDCPLSEFCDANQVCQYCPKTNDVCSDVQCRTCGNKLFHVHFQNIFLKFFFGTTKSIH